MNAAHLPEILLAEDEAIARKNLFHILTKEGYRVTAVGTGDAAVEQLRSRVFDLVITDLRMDHSDGMAVLSTSRLLHPHTEVVVVTGFATVDTAVMAMKSGAYYYIAKPYRIEEIRKIVREALLKRSLFLENRELRRALASSDGAGHMIGKSRIMKRVMETINQAAASDINLLILGESGTGKELAARSVHAQSHRKHAQFVAFNCGSFTEELMTNELFGHEKDAFTGASRKKAGLIESASGGTVFLDEVGDMPASMQMKLLRVIQEKEVLRVGGTRPAPVDVRFIAATHRNLEAAIAEGQFRQDLYYRLNVAALQMPRLRDRGGDVLLLAHYFLSMKCREMHRRIQDFSPDALSRISLHTWPGNVRELENVIEHAVAFENSDQITVESLPEYLRPDAGDVSGTGVSEFPTLQEQEIRYIRQVLEKTEGNRTQAAKIMDIDRVSLWRKMKRYGLT
ncbi:MAG: Fis family transcriptional regulator [Deltaproteobacteria bacterium]|nr:MAG: Fis family transcriptional regulator [Deltaproteobacteria bacterium]